MWRLGEPASCCSGNTGWAVNHRQSRQSRVAVIGETLGQLALLPHNRPSIDYAALRIVRPRGLSATSRTPDAPDLTVGNEHCRSLASSSHKFTGCLAGTGRSATPHSLPLLHSPLPNPPAASYWQTERQQWPPVVVAAAMSWQYAATFRSQLSKRARSAARPQPASHKASQPARSQTRLSFLSLSRSLSLFIPLARSRSLAVSLSLSEVSFRTEPANH